MKVKIKEPCHEDWNKMKIGMFSRHCDVCEKSVIDFTRKNRSEIIAYLLSNQDGTTCGRMRADQFDFRHEDIPVLIETMKRERTANPFLVLSLVCMSLASYAQQETSTEHIQTPPAIEHKIGKMIAMPETDTTSQENLPQCVEPIEPMEVEQGEIVLGDMEVQPEPEVPAQSDRKVYKFAEKMPEFPGGMAAMTRYFQEKITVKSGISGNVYIRFIVEKDGTLTHVELIRSLNARLDQAAMNAVKEMPKWTPGQVDGKNVAVYMTIPVVFRNY